MSMVIGGPLPPDNGPHSALTGLGVLSSDQKPGRIGTVQEALRKFAHLIEAQWVFDEASVALDAGRDYKITITCTETPKGYVVAMQRHQTERLGNNSFTKLSHGEWDAAPGVREDGK